MTGPIAAVGMVFQVPVLLEWRRIVDNVLLPAELAGLNPHEYHARADDLLRLAGSVTSARSFRASCRAARSSAPRSAAPCCSIRRSCSWTSLSARSTR